MTLPAFCRAMVPMQFADTKGVFDLSPEGMRLETDAEFRQRINNHFSRGLQAAAERYVRHQMRHVETTDERVRELAGHLLINVVAGGQQHLLMAWQPPPDIAQIAVELVVTPQGSVVEDFAGIAKRMREIGNE